MIDSADVITYDGHIKTVCCNHDGYLHCCGYPDDVIPESKCVLERKATADERLSLLRQLAESSGKGHRPECARRVLQDLLESGAV